MKLVLPLLLVAMCVCSASDSVYTEADVKALVLDDKWHAVVRGGVDTEVNALTLALVARIQELGVRV